MSEENLNQPDLPVAPQAEPVLEKTDTSPAEVLTPTPVSQPEAPQPQPVQVPASPAPPSTPALQPEPIKAPPPASPLPANIGLVGQLLAKAKEKIQFRKRRKLEKIVQMAALRQAQGKKITNDDVQKLLRVSDATAGRYLSQLVKEGRLRRIGHPRDAKYEPAG